MAASEKIVSLQNLDNVIDLPPPPIFMDADNEQLQNADIELHCMNGSVLDGKLHTLDGTKQLIHFVSVTQTKMEILSFDEVRFILFKAELNYVEDDKNTSSLENHHQKQPYKITFADGKEFIGNSAVTMIDDIGVNFFKVNKDDVSTRIFIPKSAIADFEVGAQIGTILKANESLTDEGLKQGLDEQNKKRSRPLGEYLKDKGIVTESDLEKVLQQQKETSEFPKVRLGELLISEGLITEIDLEEALGLQKTDRERKLGDILIDIGATTQDAVHSALASKLGLPFVKLREFSVDIDVLDHIPVLIAKKEQAMPLMMSGNRLVVAVPDPTRSDVSQILSFVANKHIEIVISTPDDIDWAINEFYGNNIDINVAQIESELLTSSNITENNDDLEKMANEKPIVRLVQNLIIESVNRGASDIHIRPLSGGVQVLFRIHGKLTLIKNFSKSLLSAIVSRIKVISRMDIAQRRLPQDGRVQMTFNDEKVDMRVSTMPTVEGESVVIRLLASAATLKPVEELGFNEKDTEGFLELLNRGAGMILVTGPTSSGKSTTLYSALNVLKKMNVNIITVEDPVEIRLDGLEQVQVLNEIGMNFGRALRNILRHDPDVIMIGEIRDEETADIAFKAAQTGHLVLSTLHTNSAADTIVRLKEMNVEPYTIASSLLGIVAQRLIAKNCEHCRINEDVSSVVRQLMSISSDEKFYISQGCDICGNSGVTGRVPAYEFLKVTEQIQNNILTNAPSLELNQTAELEGMQSIVQCALGYARNGDASIADVHRIFVS
ncbi:MAG: Flp pilus assembly complex ATPase component TadA [Proteobacteria bacterium]|nr:type II secretion system protein GspE [Pseudomonadota bacterium]NOG61253.1 Flp pilus assembly complex ATPase component TadA [Pseudomonadota bacterium]